MSAIDLNADLGEGAGTDAELLRVVSSASIACGGHAGDAKSMQATLRAATANGVTCGAHPGFADREHFGRRRLDLRADELQTQIAGQITTLKTIAADDDIPILYVKLHGALANMASEDEMLAVTAFTAVRDIDPDLAVMALANSAQERAAGKLGLTVIREAYADRAYTAAGLLAPREAEGAVLTDIDDVVRQCMGLARGKVTAIDGTPLTVEAQSICLHGDTAHAVELAHAVRAALTHEGISIRAPL